VVTFVVELTRNDRPSSGPDPDLALALRVRELLLERPDRPPPPVAFLARAPLELCCERAGAEERCERDEPEDRSEEREEGEDWDREDRDLDFDVLELDSERFFGAMKFSYGVVIACQKAAERRGSVRLIRKDRSDSIPTRCCMATWGATRPATGLRKSTVWFQAFV
jgi:hypothetical protein